MFEDIPFGLQLVWHSVLHKILSQENSHISKHVGSSFEASEEAPESQLPKLCINKDVHHQAKLVEENLIEGRKEKKKTDRHKFLR